MTATWSFGRVKLAELLVIAATLGILAAIALPVAFDPGHRSYLLRLQTRMASQGDVVIRLDRQAKGYRTGYFLKAIWRNRNGKILPWSVGDDMPGLPEHSRATRFSAQHIIVFYQQQAGGLEWIGSMYSGKDGSFRTRLNIGERNSLERWLNFPVSVDAFRSFISSDPT